MVIFTHIKSTRVWSLSWSGVCSRVIHSNVGYWRFKRNCCLRHQSKELLSVPSNSRNDGFRKPQWYKKQVLLTCLFICVRLHGITSCKIVISIVTTVRTSNLIQKRFSTPYRRQGRKKCVLEHMYQQQDMMALRNIIVLNHRPPRTKDKKKDSKYYHNSPTSLQLSFTAVTTDVNTSRARKTYGEVLNRFTKLHFKSRLFFYKNIVFNITSTCSNGVRKLNSGFSKSLVEEEKYFFLVRYSPSRA